MTQEAKYISSQTSVSADYFTVRPFLNELGATQLWANKGPKDTLISKMEAYLLGNRIVIFQEYKSGRGWDYFIQSDQHKIHDCMNELAAIAKATGQETA